jgi:dihydroorotase
MRLYFKEVEIIDSNSSFHEQKVNILIEDGKIKDINSTEETPKVDRIINVPNLKASTSWLDMKVFSGEPGEEYREDIESLSEALKYGGFGYALLMPNTNPVIQQKADIKSILAKNNGQLTQILPSSAISKDCEGEEMNEMLDLHTAGARAFTDGANPMWNSDLLVKTLQYLQKFDGLLINFPQDRKLAMFGQMNEGITSTGMGLKGIPNVAEEIMIQRDLELLRYAGGKIHFSCISTAKSLDLIKSAKEEGLKVTCDVNIHHLILDDSLLESFNTNYKLLPPLRGKADQQALVNGVKDGVIDVIVSGHQPYDEDHKKMEFDLAAFGIMGTQILYPLYHKYLKDEIPLNIFLKCINENPKTILGVKQAAIEKGRIADLTFFTDISWTFDHSTNKSKSNNSPFMGEQFDALPVALIANGQTFLSDLIN